MKLTPYIVTYNEMNYYPQLANICGLLVNHESDFGESISEIELFVRLKTVGKPISGLEFMKERFDEGLLTLPKIWFRRKNRLIEITFQTSVGELRVVPICSASSVRLIMLEFVSALQLLRKCVRKSDVSSVDAFLTGIDKRVAELDKLGNSDLLAPIN